MEPTYYLVNPDVSCREEGPEGALLFNPDTGEVLVVNGTGRLIWDALVEPCTSTQVVAALQQRCDEVPLAEVAGDVDEFLEALVTRGFIGVYRGDVHD